VLSSSGRAHVLTRIRPWSGGTNDRELVHAPKAFAFDTDFVCHARSIRDIRADDRGVLLEHLVLETMQSFSHLPRVHYWWDKAKREVDFILPFDRDRVDAVEAKWTADAFEARNLKAFRAIAEPGCWLMCFGHILILVSAAADPCAGLKPPPPYKLPLRCSPSLGLLLSLLPRHHRFCQRVAG